jgi:hypothetical protein
MKKIILMLVVTVGLFVIGGSYVLTIPANASAECLVDCYKNDPPPDKP